MKIQNSNQELRKKIENFSYGLKDRIGKGFSSVVFKGTNDQTKQTVAVKVVDLKSIRDSTGHELLKSEISVIKKLKHPNLLRCDNVFMTVNNCYIITEFCNQGDLASHLKKKNKLSEPELIEIIKDIYYGFREMAERNVIHRDIKPANVLLHNNVAKIADFGFAKFDTQPGIKEKFNIGTPLYMSPRALCENVYTLKNDIWSMGIMFYELLHGYTPWDVKTEKQLIDKMRRIPVVFKVKASKQLETLIRGCLELEESRRMGVEEIGACVNRLLEKENRVERVTELAPSKAHEMRNQQLIKACINLGRFFFKLISRLDALSDPAGQRSTIESYILNCLELLMKRLLRVVNNKIEAQALGIRNYDQFTSTNSWKKFSSVICEYNDKYAKFIAGMAPRRKFVVQDWQELSNRYLNTLKGAIGTLELNHEKEAKHIIAVDYLVTLVQILDVIGTHGLQFFAECCKIQLVVQTQPTPLSEKDVKELIYKKSVVVTCKD